MSGPVGVLAAMELSPENARVLREYARDTGSFRVTKQGATNLAAACAAALKAAAARAAVAELIEKAAAAVAALENSQSAVDRSKARMLRAALARVSGGAA